MTEEELQELEKAVDEARSHLIELNDAYNEILTKEHEENAKKNNFSRRNSDMLAFLEEMGVEVERKPKTAEEIELDKANSWHYIRFFAIIFFGFSYSPVTIMPAAILILVNFIYSIKKNDKIRKKYKSKANDAKNAEIKTEEKEKDKDAKTKDKDALYEKVCEARKAYHDLRKEYESKKLNAEVTKNAEDNNVVGTQENGMNPQLYQLYSEYIDYVKNLTMTRENRTPNNKCKIYGINKQDL